MSSGLRLAILRFGGVLLVLLGGLHLAVTPFIARLVEDNATPQSADWIVPPMLLNHIVAGILLLPLGSLIAYAAPHAAAGNHWALIVSRVIALAVASLPIALFVVMGTHYFNAVPFLCATAIVCLASVTLLLAAFWPPQQSVPRNSATAARLLEVLQELETAGISSWLDGGWGVDALLHRQTRTHKDIDIVVDVTDVPKLRGILRRRGFDVCQGSPPNSFVLADGSGLEVDVHAVVFDDEGNGVYRMQNGKDWVYPAEGFLGRGMIDGVEVRCLSATTQVLGHAHGYVPVEKDFQDMDLLEQQFGLELPSQLRRSGLSVRNQ